MNFRLCAPVPLCATLTAAMLDQLSQDCFCPADGAWPPPAFDRWRRKIKEQIKAGQRNDLDGRAANDSHMLRVTLTKPRAKLTKPSPSRPQFRLAQLPTVTGVKKTR